nr:hypothetical transcript [Hymenolepis microstoma]
MKCIGDCFYAYWQRISPFSKPICPVCRGQLRFVPKRLTLPEMQSSVSSNRFRIESNVDLFNRRYSGNPVSEIAINVTANKTTRGQKPSQMPPIA